MTPIRYTRLWLGLGVVIVGSFAVLGYFGGEALPPGPADPGARGHDRRPGALHRRGHQGRPERLAVDGRAGGRIGLGPRGVRRARLVGRLAPPRGDLAARPLGRAPSTASPTTTLARRGRRRALKARLKEELRRNTYDPATGDLTVSPLAGRGDRGRRRALRGAVRRRPGARQAAGRLRDPGRTRSTTRERQRQLNAFFFWTSWACVDEPARRRDHLHQQLAARAADRQPADRRRSSSGRA